jgi:hypothetical protein
MRYLLIRIRTPVDGMFMDAIAAEEMVRNQFDSFHRLCKFRVFADMVLGIFTAFGAAVKKITC